MKKKLFCLIGNRFSALPGLAGLLILSCLCAGCRHEVTTERRSAYYWSTVFETDSAQQAFLFSQHVGRIYLRYFDVVMRDGQPMPNATVRFSSEKPRGVEVVPTVYILNECMEQASDGLDSLLFSRIMQMSETHDMGPIGELQIDCDWTRRTQTRYFAMLDKLRRRANARGVSLSVTIRLHQLSMAPPPADRGVLMMYNTGDVTNLRVENPILDMADVAPYLADLSDYGLPLSTAYPVFAWRVQFRGPRFVGIVHADGEYPMMAGDTVVFREPPLSTVMAARRAVDRYRPEANREVILFDMSKQNINRINQHHYEKVFYGHDGGSDAQP